MLGMVRLPARCASRIQEFRQIEPACPVSNAYRSGRHCHAAADLRSFWSPGSQRDAEDQLRSIGCLMSINPDAHSTRELDLAHWASRWPARAGAEGQGSQF